LKLTKFTIRNFKGIKELSIDVENITVIIGPNNCSKSTILQALKLFGSSNKKIDSDFYFRHNTSEPISFHATFSDISVEEAVLHGIKASIHSESNSFIVRAIYSYGQDVKRSSKTSGSLDHDLEEDGWDGKMGGGNNASHFLNVFPEVIYIPAVKNASDELKTNSDNMKTLTTLYKEIVHSLDEYTEAEEKTRLLQNKINQHDDQKIKYFESEVQSFLNDVTSTKINFKVDVKPIDEIVSTSVSPFFNYNGIETGIEFQGNGVQRTFIVSILKGFRKFKNKYSTDKKEESQYKRSLIIAIEEPELYLHPQIAKIFKDTLYSLADDNLFQVIATSHSPSFIDLSKPNRTLAKLSLDEYKMVNVAQVSSDIYSMGADDVQRFQALLKFNPYINEVFFADRAILVEGDTEVVTFKLIGEKLVENGILTQEMLSRTSVVNCAGKATMYIVLNILNNFGIDYSVVHDLDITELNSKGQRRSPSALKTVITINHKLEQLALARGNRKFVFQHTFEAEMPADYEKGSSKSFSAYEYLKEKSLEELPERFINVIKGAYALKLDTPIDHSVETLLPTYKKNDWPEFDQALIEWEAPMKEEYLKTFWVEKMIAVSEENDKH